MTFWSAFRQTYAGGIAFLVACPLLALVPVAVELVQHVVEIHIGMYDSVAAAKAADGDPMRMAFGFVKILSLLLPGYWVARFLAWRDPVRARAWDGRAVRLFAGFVAFEAALAAVQLFALPRTGAVLAVTFVIGQVVAALVAAWAAAAPVGNAAIGPRASIAVMARQLPWTMVFQLVAVLPLMIPHYALGAAAILGPKPLLWPVLIVDSLLVGWLAVTMMAAGWFAAVRATARAGVSLLPD